MTLLLLFASYAVADQLTRPGLENDLLKSTLALAPLADLRTTGVPSFQLTST